MSRERERNLFESELGCSSGRWSSASGEIEPEKSSARTRRDRSRESLLEIADQTEAIRDEQAADGGIGIEFVVGGEIF